MSFGSERYLRCEVCGDFVVEGEAEAHERRCFPARMDFLYVFPGFMSRTGRFGFDAEGDVLPVGNGFRDLPELAARVMADIRGRGDEERAVLAKARQPVRLWVYSRYRPPGSQRFAPANPIGEVKVRFDPEDLSATFETDCPCLEREKDLKSRMMKELFRRGE